MGERRPWARGDVFMIPNSLMSSGHAVVAEGEEAAEDHIEDVASEDDDG